MYGNVSRTPQTMAAKSTAESHRRVTRRRVKLTVATACAVVSGMLLMVQSASARQEIGYFGNDGTTATTFSSVQGAAIDQGNRRAYIYDGSAASGKLYGYDISTSGTYTPLGGNFPISPPAGGQIQNDPRVAVDNSGLSTDGNIYVAGSGILVGYDANGNLLPGFPINSSDYSVVQAYTRDVSVDSHGHIWLADQVNEVFREFDSSGNLLNTVDASWADRPCWFDFDSHDNIVFSDQSRANLWKIDAPNYDTHTQIHKEGFGDTEVLAVEFDRSNDSLFVAHGGGFSSGSYVDQLGPTFALQDRFATGLPTGFQSFTAIAVDESADQAYVAAQSDSRVHIYKPSPPPVATQLTADSVSTTKATVSFHINPVGGNASYYVEYGTADCNLGGCKTTPTSVIEGRFGEKTLTADLDDLTAATQYHFRVVTANTVGDTVTSADATFTTFSSIPFLEDTCPNALARQQSGATFLLDCRAYELVSASDTSGYDVESNLLPGQMPFADYPQAENRVLYGVHNGGIPNTGDPPNKGVDAFVATRDEADQRWNTEYVGIPSTAPSSAPFASSLLGADSGLENFAFGGSDFCNPCFDDGSTGIPIHRPDGSLIQGMVGSIDVSNPMSAGGVFKHFSDDGSHFLFSSMQQFEPEGNSSGTDATIYSRNLKAGTTEVVSTNPSGAPIADGDNLAALDVSANGSRVVFGDRVSTDATGNDYHHLYLHIAGTPESIDLTPGTTSGALYAGMTSDASQVYFTTPDPLASDNDTSSDLYRADIAENGAMTLVRVSTGTGAGDTDSCDPTANSFNSENWNVVPGGPTDCSVVAVGGGGGVASSSGTAYFLSPERLDGNGVAGAPNLFVAQPSSSPEFVATLESSATTPLELGSYQFTRGFGTFDQPRGVAIDGQDGSTYVMDLNSAGSFGGPIFVQKLDSAGNPDMSFGTNSILSGFTGTGGSLLGIPTGTPTQIAVDNSTSSSSGDLYVIDSPFGPGTVKKFSPDGGAPSSGATDLPAGLATMGVAVSPVNGTVYAVDLLTGVFEYDANGNPTGPGTFSVGGFSAQPRAIAVDSTGRVFVAKATSTDIYDGATGSPIGTLDPHPSNGVTVDPTNDHIYVDRGNEIVEYDQNLHQVNETFGASEISGSPGSVGVSAYAGRVVTSNDADGNILEYNRGPTPKNTAYDSPLVIDSVRESSTRHTSDFQITPNGQHAVFATVLQLTDYVNNGHYEIYVTNLADNGYHCVSCPVTNVKATADASIASNGLSVADDGRVFFTSGSPLVPRDLNHENDAYEWSNGDIQLVSSGTSEAGSSLLGVSANGTDAYFFTRDTLVKADHNGPRVKIYDARERGGFFIVPPPASCVASDECHGPGTQAAGFPDVSTLAGKSGQYLAPVRCSPTSLSRKAHRASLEVKRLRRAAQSAADRGDTKLARRLRVQAKRQARAAKHAKNVVRRCRARHRKSAR